MASKFNQSAYSWIDERKKKALASGNQTTAKALAAAQKASVKNTVKTTVKNASSVSNSSKQTAQKNTAQQTKKKKNTYAQKASAKKYWKEQKKKEEQSKNKSLMGIKGDAYAGVKKLHSENRAESRRKTTERNGRFGTDGEVYSDTKNAGKAFGRRGEDDSNTKKSTKAFGQRGEAYTQKKEYRSPKTVSENLFNAKVAGGDRLANYLVVKNEIDKYSTIDENQRAINQMTQDELNRLGMTANYGLSAEGKKAALQEALPRRTFPRTPLQTMMDVAKLGYTTKDLQRAWRATVTDEQIKSAKEYAEKGKEEARKTAEQLLSRADKTLPAYEQQLIREAKTRYDKAKKAGDADAFQKAHTDAENIRKAYGYSGGASGSEGTLLNQPQTNTDGEGRSRYTPQTREELVAQRKAMAGVESVGYGLLGKPLALAETAIHAARPDILDEEYKKALDERDLAWAAFQHYDIFDKENEKWLEAWNRYAKAQVKLDGMAKKAVPQDLPGQRMTARSGALAAEATTGLTGPAYYAAQAEMAAGNMIPALVGTALTGNPLVGGAIMGAQAAGGKAQELNERGYAPGVSLARGAASGVAEGVAEAIPFFTALRILKAPGGKNIAITALKNAGFQGTVEALEEGATDGINYALDKAAKDPEARLTMQQLRDDMIVGALLGGVMGGGASVAGRPGQPVTERNRLDESRQTEQTPPPPEDGSSSLSGKARDASADMPIESPVNDPVASRTTIPKQPQETAQARETANRGVSFDDRQRRLVEDGIIAQDKEIERRFDAAQTIEEKATIANEWNEKEREWRDALGVPDGVDVINFINESRQSNTQPNADVALNGENLTSTDASNLASSATDRATTYTPRATTNAERVTKPENDIPISERGYEDVGSRKVHSYQFDHPELHPYFVEAAKVMQRDLLDSVKGERFYLFDEGGIAEVSGVKRSVSDEVRRALDELHLSYKDIGKALDAIIADNGQENYAAAKRVELLLDDILTYGSERWSMRDYVDPNEDYIRAKARISGREPEPETESAEELTGFDAYEESQGSPKLSQDSPKLSQDGTEFEPVETSDRLPEGLGAASAGFDPFTAAVNRYGSIEEGENPSRMVDVPRSTDGNNRVSKFARTVMEAGVTRDETVEAIENQILDDAKRLEVERDLEAQGFVYRKKTLKETQNRAYQTIRDLGADGALMRWEDVVEGRRAANDDDIALGLTLYAASENAGNTDMSKRLAAEIAAMGTISGRMSNANRLLKRATPEGQVFYLRKTVESLNEDLAERAGRSGNGNGQLLYDEVVEQRDDALNLLRELHETMSQSEQKAGPDDWMQEVGRELAQRLSAQRRGSNPRPQPISRIILNDLLRFADEHGLPKAQKQQNRRTAADRITDFFRNREEYSRAWNAAKENLRERYRGNQQALDEFEEFLNSTIPYNGNGTDAVMFRAIADAAVEEEISRRQIDVRSVMDNPALVTEVYDSLQNRVRAEGADAVILRDAVQRYFNERALSSDAEGLVNTDIRRQMKEIGVKMSDLIKQGAATKRELAAKISDMLRTEYGISDGNNAFSMKVLNTFNARVSEESRAALETRFRERGERMQKDTEQKITELGNMGAFYSDRFNSLATKSIFGVEDVSLNEDLVRRFLDAEDKQSKDDALDEIYDDVASQLPPTIGARVNAWRYFAMLGNPRTHIRNLIGNVMFLGAEKGARGVSAIGQLVLPAEKRTRSLVATKAAKEFAKQDYQDAKDLLSGNKYTDEKSKIKRMAQDKAFKLGAWNGRLLEAEDMLFKKAHYQRSMAEFITARKWNPATMTRRQIEEARTHAINDALEGTFQTESAFVNALGKLERTNAATKLFVGGVVPFKGVPINIAKQGFAFSPVGFVKSLTYDISKMRKGEKTAADLVDSLSKNLTGSGLFAVGAWLAYHGWLSGGEDDKKEAALSQGQGSQNYALNIGDYSYTMDWAAPAALPMFMGAELYSALTKKGEDEDTAAKTVFESAERLFDPMLEMTVLSGLSSLTSSYGESFAQKISGTAETVLTNFAGQFVPTLLGQIARTVDDTRRTTYVDKSSPIPDVFQRFIQQQENKIPGVSKKNVPYLNIWGEEDRTENWLLRAVENFVSPGYISKIQEDGISDELLRLRDLGYEGTVPSTVQKGQKLDLDGDGEKERLSREQWEKYQKEYGQTAKSALSSVFSMEEYKAMSDADKAELAKNIISFTKSLGKASAADNVSILSSFGKKFVDGGFKTEDIPSVLLMKKAMDADGNGSIKQSEMVEGIRNKTADQAEQERYYNLFKSSNAKKTWTEAVAAQEEEKKTEAEKAERQKEAEKIAKQYGLTAEQTAKLDDAYRSKYDEGWSSATYQKFWTACKEMGLSDSEMEAYYYYANSQKDTPWTRKWGDALKHIKKDKKGYYYQ